MYIPHISFLVSDAYIMHFIIGLQELRFKFLSLFYSEFLLKSLHYAQFYSFYVYDFIIILHFSSKFLNNLGI